jgi:chemotaxis protein methyltransferase CheR
MTGDIGPADVGYFREVLAGRLGLSLQNVSATVLTGILRDRLAAHRCSGTAYLNGLAEAGPPREVAELARALTVAETYFFRNIEQFRAFRDVVVPDSMLRRAAERRLRFVSVGCASGEEPYTVAMVVREAVADRSWDVAILGVDVNPAVLGRAERARYSEWSLRATPHGMRERWFRPDSGSMVLDDDIRRSVRFSEGNLVEDDPRLWPGDTYDAVFCRNVLMYLTPEHVRRAVSRLAGALAPGGYLFLGHTETQYGRSAGLELRHSHDTFYFQRTATAQTPAPAVLPADWVATIGAAAGRIRGLTTVPHMPSAAGPAAPRSPAVPGWDRALELLRRERLAEALAIVEALPPDSRTAPDALTLHAALLTQCNKFDRAEQVCRQLLELDGLNAGAHYLLALCREGSGNWQAAARHGRTAAYLDPGFAMPRLQLGLLARQRGDRVAARRELGSALMLLSREDTQRLLLFGGGFTRQALIALCRTELAACGGPA